MALFWQQKLYFFMYENITKKINEKVGNSLLQDVREKSFLIFGWNGKLSLQTSATFPISFDEGRQDENESVFLAYWQLSLIF